MENTPMLCKRICLVLLATSIVCMPVRASDRENARREIAAAREHIHALLREAEELGELGRVEEAEQTRREAEALQERLANHVNQMEREWHLSHLHEALAGLERGIGALRELGRHEAAARLERIADEVREELGAPRHRERRAYGDREILINRIELLRMVIPVLLEAGRVEAAETVERAVRANEIRLEGRDDREARRIRERAPGRGQIIEILGLAEELYREYGLEEKADHLGHLADDLWERQRHKKRRRVDDELPEHVRHDLEVMKMAMHALQEARKRDAADVLRRGIQARVVDAKGLEGEEANLVRERAPSLGQQVEILAWAAELWREFGHEEKSEAVAELAERMWADRHEGRHQIDGVTRERIETMEATIAGLQQVIDGLREEIQQLRRQR